MKTALITDVTGQDGVYLSEFLLKKDYYVHSIKCRSSSFNTQRIDHFYQAPHVADKHFILHHGDLTDTSNLIRIVRRYDLMNLYGIGVNYNLEDSHVLPAIIRKFHEAKVTEKNEVILWGDGSPIREFLYSNYLADAVVYEDDPANDPPENICQIVWDRTKPNGTPYKFCDTSRLRAFGFISKTEHHEGIVVLLINT
jgi:hypothetical protein